MSKEDVRKRPAPGSQEAVRRGCLCSILHNNSGQGIFIDAENIERYGGRIFWYASDCPVHVMVPMPVKRKVKR